MKVEYTCKFCRNSFSFDTKDYTPQAPDVLPIDEDMKKFIPNLACDRCAQFERKRKDTEEVIVRYSEVLVRLNQAKAPASLDEREKRDQTRLEMTKKIGAALAIYVNLFSDYLMKNLVFEEMFAESIVTKPESAWYALARYRRGTMPREKRPNEWFKA